MEDVRKEMEWEDEEFFATATTPMRHLRSEGVPKRRSEAEGLTADVSSNGKLVDWWGSLYEEQDDFDELVEEYLKPRDAPDSRKCEEDDNLLREDDFGMSKDDCEDDLLEETPSKDPGMGMMGRKDQKDASLEEDLVPNPPGNVVEDRSQDEPDLSGAVPTPRDDILFLPTGGTTKSIIPADRNNSFVQSGQFVEEQEYTRTGMTDKEFTAVSIKDKDGGMALDDDEAGTRSKCNTMDSLMIQKDVGHVTPSSGLIHHH